MSTGVTLNTPATPLRVLVLHGPNLNLLGMREPQIYGSLTLAQVNGHIEDLARELQVEVQALQSNHEGVLVDALHAGIGNVAGALLNPAGLTGHSVSLHDAIKAVPFPVLEIHLSNIAAREEWRDRSIISSAVRATVQGLGWRSYTAGLRALVEVIRESTA